MKFELVTVSHNSRARAGKLFTEHGTIETPIFMPVGTAGTVKGVHTRDLRDDIHAQIILGNTYHLYLRPGMDVIEKAGGLHKFNGWDKPLLTDSGGFQVFSLGDIRKLRKRVPNFNLILMGLTISLLPESVIDIQRTIGADIMMAFDECTPGDADYSYAKKSMELTHRWLDRCFVQLNNTLPKYGYAQSLFPIVQGSTYADLRKLAVAQVKNTEADGYAIGGLSVGEKEEVMYEMTEVVTADLPENKPRYLMGVGTPENILESIDRGVDMFDCVMPSRNGRNGMLFTSNGKINIRNKKWENDHSPIDEMGISFVDNYTKAYLRHLVISNEMLGAQIATQHNLAFYLWLVKTARTKIIEGNFISWKNEMLIKLKQRL
ncbi:MAG: tRNA guanosine(34) transglycosylase Tgt [Draconibacterium sp.]|nr:tRNA guanosine(34) transglycosylase Tgt [Draconibacterium sp.]